MSRHSSQSRNGVGLVPLHAACLGMMGRLATPRGPYSQPYRIPPSSRMKHFRNSSGEPCLLNSSLISRMGGSASPFSIISSLVRSSLRSPQMVRQCAPVTSRNLLILYGVPFFNSPLASASINLLTRLFNGFEYGARPNLKTLRIHKTTSWLITFVNSRE